MNVGNPRYKNTVLGSVLCCHDRGMLAKSANIWLSGRHVADMLATFPAKLLGWHGEVNSGIGFAADVLLGEVDEAEAGGSGFCGVLCVPASGK